MWFLYQSDQIYLLRGSQTDHVRNMIDITTAHVLQ